MVFQTLSFIADSLSGHLSRVFELPDGIVQLASASGGENGSLPNKVTVSLVNLERETAGGISFTPQASGDRFRKMPASWQINLYVLIAAQFSEKQYAEGLRFLSESVRFLRNNATLTLPVIRQKLALEPVNLTFTELSNLWSICGGSYRPSVLCKVRVLEVGGAEMTGTVTSVTRKETGL